MTLAELQAELHQHDSLRSCDAFLNARLHQIRPLFYGLTRDELQDNYRYLDYETVFLAFTNSPCGQALRAGEPPPASILALLIFFLSLFERARLYTAILGVADIIPPGTLRNRAEAIFHYKHIHNARIDYITRFPRIIELLQTSWQAGEAPERTQCEDLLQEYALDALVEPLAAGSDIRAAVIDCFSAPATCQRYPLLVTAAVQRAFTLPPELLAVERAAVRCRIVESMHDEACRLVPNALIDRQADEFQGQEVPDRQAISTLPDYLEEQLAAMGAEYRQLRQEVRTNFDADPARNRIYLGTYFPKTVIESRNVLGDLLSIPDVARAFQAKPVIRILDVGSGTGGASIGALLALADWGGFAGRVDLCAVDANEDALGRQAEILAAIGGHLPFQVFSERRNLRLPFDLEAFRTEFASLARQEGHRFDIVLIWKFLSEFYNVGYANAQGVTRSALEISSRMLVPRGLCIALDVTSNDNGNELFSIIFNRETNAFDLAPGAPMRTIVPIPCTRHLSACHPNPCFTQRIFSISHRLSPNDRSKVAYRVLAPVTFRDTICATFTQKSAYHVNAARAESCHKGRRAPTAIDHPSGFTGFFAESDGE